MFTTNRANREIFEALKSSRVVKLDNFIRNLSEEFDNGYDIITLHVNSRSFNIVEMFKFNIKLNRKLDVTSLSIFDNNVDPDKNFIFFLSHFSARGVLNIDFNKITNTDWIREGMRENPKFYLPYVEKIIAFWEDFDESKRKVKLMGLDKKSEEDFGEFLEVL